MYNPIIHVGLLEIYQLGTPNNVMIQESLYCLSDKKKICYRMHELVLEK